MPEEYEKRSAVKWADKINIPILIVHGGSKDWRVSTQQAKAMAANSVMSHYVALARREQINKIDVRCVLGNDSGVEDVDLCVLLGNLLENAIEGCKPVAPPQREIKLRINSYLGQLLLTVDNSFDGILETENGEFLSCQRGNGQKGIGLSSIEAIAQKYGA